MNHITYGPSLLLRDGFYHLYKVRSDPCGQYNCILVFSRFVLCHAKHLDSFVYICQHYSTMSKVRVLRPVEQRFWIKVHKSDGCWLWTACVNNMGYGEFRISKGSQGLEYAHRFSWTLHNGPIPDGMKVLHKCDTPRCVRPDHLFLGSQKDNIHDCIGKGRNPVLTVGHLGSKGEKHGMSKLTQEQIIDIRQRYVGGVNQFNPSNRRKLAEEFGIKPNHVWQIYTRKVWKHIP